MNLIEIKKNQRTKKWFVGIMMMSLIVGANSMAFAATDTKAIFETISEMVGEIYTGIVGISTLVAAVGCAVAFIIRMVSRNTKSIEEANAWIKRIAFLSLWLMEPLLPISLLRVLSLFTEVSITHVKRKDGLIRPFFINKFP